MSDSESCVSESPTPVWMMMVIARPAKLHPWSSLHSLQVVLPLESFVLPPELFPGYVTSGRHLMSLTGYL